MSLCSTWLAHFCFCLLTFLLWLTLVGSSLFIHGGYLLNLVKFLHVGMDPCALRRLSLICKSLQGSFALSSAVSQWILPNKLKFPEQAEIFSAEVQGSCSTTDLSQFLPDFKLPNLVVNAAEAALSLHVCNGIFLLCEQ